MNLPSQKHILTNFGLILLGAVCVLVTDPTGNFPLNDDWQYAWPVKILVEQHRLEFKGVFAPNVLLQIGWGWLFCKLAGGFNFNWLRYSTLVTAFVALFAFYRLGKTAGVRPQIAGLASVVLGFNPLFYSLAFTFMSDVPFLALCLLSLLAFQKHLENESTGWLVLACFWAVCSFCIRQPGIVLLPCFAIFKFIQAPSLKNMGTGGILVVSAAAIFMGLEHWVKPLLGISDNYVPVGELYSKALLETPLNTLFEWVKKAIKTFVYLGVFALPLLPFFLKKMQQQRFFAPKPLMICLSANLLLLLILLKSDKVFPFGGNVMFNIGLGPELLADVYTRHLPNSPRLPSWSMLLLNFTGQLSATWLLAYVLKNFKILTLQNRRFAGFLLLLNAVYLPLMSITSFFDRYLLLPIASFTFILAMLLSSNDWNRPAWWRWLPLAAMCWFSIAATHDYLDWNRARRSAFEHAISAGANIQEMDAGYEYNGFYNYHKNRQEVAGRSFWWVNEDKWMLSFGPVNGYSTVSTFPYQRWLFFENDAIHVLKRE